jgi:NAD(P)-dependent dehydrogenase (short-subunit alcohol dehydrogenase family)
MTRFKDKTAIVTGAAGGIGRATAIRLAQEGARVMLLGRHADKAKEPLQATLEAGAPDADVWEADVSDEAQVEGACEEVIRRWGRLDVIVNNAGVMTFDPIVDLTEAEWMKVLRIDLLGAAWFMKHGFKRMRPGSAIVNVASIHAIMTTKDAAPYAAAKAATCSLSRTGAIEARELKIRVNTLLPGAIDTPMLWDNPNVKSGAEKIDRFQVGRPEDIAAGIAFLASDDAAFVNGIELVVDGGRLAQL